MHLIVVEDWDKALSIVRSEMGWWHEYYARASRVIGALGLVLRVNGRDAGSVIYYKVTLPSLSIGVIYYVVVKSKYRGMSYGKILVASAEELLQPVDMVVATISGGNKASIAMFESMAYRLYSWEELDSVNSGLSEVIYRVTCSYEDDIVAIKTSLDLTKLKPGSLDIDESMRIWDLACYTPWRRLKKGRLYV